MRKKRNIIIFLCIIMCAVGILFPSGAYATESNDMVRVGLVSRYQNKSSITIKNTMITCGYWSSAKNKFVGNEVFTSKTGFVFEPLTQKCFVSENSYKTYDAAALAAKSLSGAKVSVFPALLHDNYWKLYVVGNREDSDVAASYGKERYSEVTDVTRYKMKVTGSFGAFVIDVDDTRVYPMFAATSTNARGDYTVNVEGKFYRGYIEIGRYGDSGVTAVNILSMEEYLYGVVSSEMSFTWPIEALKAQAVVARSYAATTDTIGALAHVSSGGYVLVDTVKHQAYGGYSSEYDRTTQAVDETKGKMLYYSDSVIKAYYFSTSGGSTEDAQAVWNIPIKYFKQVSDVVELYPAKAPWVVSYSMADLNAKLGESGYNIGNVTDVTKEITTQSGRAYSLRFKGTNSSLSITKTNISSVLSLPSTKFKIVKYGDNSDSVSVIGSSTSSTINIKDAYILSADSENARMAPAIEQYVVMGADNLENYVRLAPTNPAIVYFAGMGFGHGVGMSQSGAYSMAREGSNYVDILKHYYTDVEIR